MRPLLIAFLLAASMGACSGGSEDDSDGDNAAARPSPTEEEDSFGEEPPDVAGAPAPQDLPGRPTRNGTLRPGRYHTSLFEPAALFKVGRGWEAAFEEDDSLVLLLEPEPNDQAIYLDSSQATLSVDEVLRFVRQTFTGLAERRNFRFTGEGPAPTGDLDGEGYTMEVLADQPLVTLELGTESYEVKPGDKLNIRALDIGGYTMLVFVEASGDEFDAFLPKAEKVLSTLDFVLD